jgi:hypothetical protein
MTINWMPWDLCDSFNVFNAACLWLEIEPSLEVSRNMPYEVSVMMNHIQKRAASYGTNSMAVTRAELLKIAEDIGQKPKFLFPEMRPNSTEPTTPDLENSALSTKVRKSYLRLIKGLLKNADIEPTERGLAKLLEGMVTRSGETLSQDTLRDILKEINSQQIDESLDLKVVLGILAELKNLDQKPI